MSPSSIQFAAGLLVRDERGDYRRASPAEVLHAARNVLAKRVRRGTKFSAPQAVREFLTVKLGHLEHEVFMVILLDNQHQLIEACEMFRGTIDGASVYPREVVKEALTHNAAAVIFAHNHPSGVPEPSAADRALTERLKAALAVVDIRVLDHFVVGGESVISFAERGWI
jgi:DNA repair protein RadC